MAFFGFYIDPYCRLDFKKIGVDFIPLPLRKEDLYMAIYKDRAHTLFHKYMGKWLFHTELASWGLR
jgi:hypothetical protein